ncbi:GNAT family N-acetyltransferase [Cellulomonas soli]
MTLTYHRAPTAQVDPLVLYRLLRLRVQVFVVEQHCAYEDLDGRDVEPGTELLWATDGDEVVSTVRVLHDPTALRIGRVATAPAARSRGVAGELMRRAVERCTELDPTADIVLGAQAHLAPGTPGSGSRWTASRTTRTTSRTCRCGGPRTRDKAHERRPRRHLVISRRRARAPPVAVPRLISLSSHGRRRPTPTHSCGASGAC